jgi:hypothetical protein
VPSGGEIWLTDGSAYKFILRDSNDVLIATYDNVTGINSNFIAFTNEQEIQTATAGQTVFNLTTTTYSPGTNSLSVFVDGVNQYGPGAQYAYVETDNDTVTFVNGLHVGALVKFTTSQLNSSGLQANAFQVSYTPPFTNSVGTNVGDKLAQTVSVKDFGAVGDGVTDDTAAIQTALNTATAAGQAVIFPAGNYLSTTGGVTLSPGVVIIGEGQGITTFTLANAATLAYFTYSGANALPGTYQFSSFTLTGSWLTDPTQNGLALVVLNFAPTPSPISVVKFNDVEISYSRGFGIVTDVTARTEAINCWVHHINRDGIYFNDSQDKVYINCLIEHTADNGISGHVVAPFTSTPVVSRLTIQNCRLIDTYGASFIGVSEATISNVYCARSKGIAFRIGVYEIATSLGFVSSRHVSIKNLVIEDTINQSVDGTGTAAVGLQIGSYSASGGLANIPLRPTTGGVIIPPEPYIYNLGTSTNTVTVPNGAGWDIQAIIRQTLPAVTNYSDWGFGDMFGQNGLIDPQITDANLGIQGIVLFGGLRDARIQAIVEPRSGGVLITSPSSPDYLFQNVVFENCSFVRCVGNVINTDAVSVDVQDIKFLNCWFDVDPRFESTQRATSGGDYTGAWTFTATTAIVQGATNIDGITFEGCHFRNCQSLDTTQASGNPVNYLGLNYLHCNPGNVGGSSANVGIGVVKPAGGNFAYVVEVCDPRQTATYNNVITAQYFDAASIPTTGTWVRGAFVRNNTPVVASSKVTLGWARITTGSANVNGTDWTPAVATIS